MKKILILLLMLPVTILAIPCETIKDSSDEDNRNLVCDAEKRTMTTFKTNQEEIELENSVCTIKCTEEIVFSIDPIKKVLAGTSFNYPLYASGERKCRAEYNYAQYETKIRTLVNEYASLTGTAKNTKANEITNYYAERKACDDFSTIDSEYEKKYKYNGDVTLKVETSTNEVEVQYVFKEIEEYSNNKILDEVNYTNSCKFNESNMTCSNNDKSVIEWTETARIFGKYTMRDSYIEKYTGEVRNTYSENTCNIGDRFFVNYDELTRPVENDPTDKGYKLTLIANDLGKNIGKNLVLNGNGWNLNVECWYQVKNLTFPKDGDDNFDDYGGIGFQYRIIDLDNPFPERSPWANWVGKEDIIYSTKNDLPKLQRFVIQLDRSSIDKIREYNDMYPYDTFNLNEMEKSPFIVNLADQNIIDRK